MYDKDNLNSHISYLEESLDKILSSSSINLIFEKDQFYISITLSGENACNIGFIDNKWEWACWDDCILYDEKSEAVNNACLSWVKNVTEDKYRKNKCAEFTSLIWSELCVKLNQYTSVEPYNKT